VTVGFHRTAGLSRHPRPPAPADCSGWPGSSPQGCCTPVAISGAWRQWRSQDSRVGYSHLLTRKKNQLNSKTGNQRNKGTSSSINQFEDISIKQKELTKCIKKLQQCSSHQCSNFMLQCYFMASKGSFNFAFLHGLEAVNDITFLHLHKELALNKCDQAIIQILIPHLISQFILHIVHGRKYSL